MRSVYLIVRFVQLLAIIPLGLGLANAGSFFELLNGLAAGQAWDFAEFAKRLVVFSSPLGFGVVLLPSLELLLRRQAVTEARSLQFPDQPWLWKSMWAERQIRLSNGTTVWICLAAFFAFTFIIVPVGLWMKSKMRDAPIGIGLGLCGLLLLAVMRMAWLNRRWGNSVLELLTLPGVVGGPFRGTVILSEFLPEGTALRVTLNCVRIRTVRMRPSGDQHSTTDTIWQDQKILVTATSMSHRDGVAIPCSFAIPFSCEPTSLDTIGLSRLQDPDDHVSISWQLSVGMKDPMDLRNATFEIPVFRTESSSPNYREDAAVDAPYLEPVDIDEVAKSLPLQRADSASGEILRFSFMRTRDFVLMLLFTLALMAGVWAIFRYVSMPGACFAALLPVVLLVACCKTLVEALTWKAEIEINAKGTTFMSGYRWSRRTCEYPRGRLPTLECHPEFRRQSGSLYCVRMIPPAGSPLILVKRLDGKQNAVAVRDWLMKQLRQP